MAAGAHAGTINLGTSALTDLIGEGPAGGGDLLVTDMSNGILHAQVLSQCFAAESGDYVYLYQVNNTGTGTNSSVELFTLAPFLGAGNDPLMGWLTGDVPAGFLSTSIVPEDTGYFNTENVVSFYFTERVGDPITPSEHSTVLYAVSTYAPGLITGNLIGARVSTGDVVGPVVPEPSTLVLIGMGLAALIVARRRMA
jgi:hypothetical protein